MMFGARKGEGKIWGRFVVASGYLTPSLVHFSMSTPSHELLAPLSDALSQVHPGGSSHCSSSPRRPFCPHTSWGKEVLKPLGLSPVLTFLFTS